MTPPPHTLDTLSTADTTPEALPPAEQLQHDIEHTDHLLSQASANFERFQFLHRHFPDQAQHHCTMSELSTQLQHVVADFAATYARFGLRLIDFTPHSADDLSYSLQFAADTSIDLFLHTAAEIINTLNWHISENRLNSFGGLRLAIRQEEFYESLDVDLKELYRQMEADWRGSANFEFLKNCGPHSVAECLTVWHGGTYDEAQYRQMFADCNPGHLGSMPWAITSALEATAQHVVDQRTHADLAAFVRYAQSHLPLITKLALSPLQQHYECFTQVSFDPDGQVDGFFTPSSFYPLSVLGPQLQSGIFYEQTTWHITDTPLPTE